MVAGVLFVFSSGVTSSGEIYSYEYVKQIIWASTGLLLLLGFALFNYNRLRYFAPYAYLACIALLILTLIIGIEKNGAKSWLGFGDTGIQPSEFMKVATILLLGSYFAAAGNRIRELPVFLLGLGICAVPMAIVMLQPDLGTAMVYLPIFLIMTYVGGTKARYIAFIILVGVCTLALSVLPYFERLMLGKEFPVFSTLLNRKVMLIFLGALAVIMLFSAWGYVRYKKQRFYWIIYTALVLFVSIVGFFGAQLLLKEYQIMRLMIFLNPNLDPQGAGWNIIQSVTAIGSGGFSGKGFMMGTQSHYNYLPQQSTDFIFSILSEEWGFVGSFFVLLAFLIILLRGIRILHHAKDEFALMIGSGVLAMIFFHVVVNIGMTMGIMPVTGIPLMLISRGGSALWTACIGLGILLNIYLRRYRY